MKGLAELQGASNEDHVFRDMLCIMTQYYLVRIYLGMLKEAINCFY